MLSAGNTKHPKNNFCFRAIGFNLFGINYLEKAQLFLLGWSAFFFAFNFYIKTKEHNLNF